MCRQLQPFRVLRSCRSTMPRQWALLRLRRRKPRRRSDGRRYQARLAPSLQCRESKSPESAFEVSSGLKGADAVVKLANPPTGGKVFWLPDAIPICECRNPETSQAPPRWTFSGRRSLLLQVGSLRLPTPLQSSTHAGPPLNSRHLRSGRRRWMPPGFT